MSKEPMVYDVVISGAGPVGLFLACELALAKCSVLILEKASSPQSPLKTLPFGIRGLSAPTIEALDRRGLLTALEVPKRLKDPHQAKPSAPGAKPRRQLGHFAGISFYDDHLDPSRWPYRLPSSTPTSLISELEELETVLTRRAEALNVEIKRGFATTGVQQTEATVTVRSGDQAFQGKWLVGCDGSRSVVRKAGAFRFEGTEPEFTGYTAQVDLVDPDKLKLGRNQTPTGMYLQSQPGYIVIQDFDGGAAHSSEEPLTLETLQAVLRRISNTDVTIRTLHFATTWTDRARQATTYRNGRIFLAGDAAHIHSPLGGQGLNLGLGDAMNLGWKLAAAVHEKAPAGLLDSYHAERYPIGAQVLDWSRAQVAIMKPAPEARALYAVIGDLMNTRDGTTYIAARVWGVGTHYKLSGEHSMVGHSVPNFEFEDGTRLAELMHAGQGVLLDFEGRAPLKSLAGEYGGQIKYLSGRAKEQLGLSTVLIRPDGVIAWASSSEPAEPSLRQAAALWFGS